MIDLLWPPFLLSVVLVGIHGWFGLEILRRGIIFTDLAVGQTAALGAAVALLLFGGEYALPMGLLFALAGGGLIALVSGWEVHLEAFIGLLYAFAGAMAVILLTNAPHGMEAFSRLMAADILFVAPEAIFSIAGVYALVGAFLFFLYPRLSGAGRDLLFFLTLSVTVALSVQLAGVFMVFALLVAPAFIALKAGAKRPLLLAWGVGVLLNMAGVGLSYAYDLPTGYAIVAVQTLAGMVFALKPGKNRG